MPVVIEGGTRRKIHIECLCSVELIPIWFLHLHVRPSVTALCWRRSYYFINLNVSLDGSSRFIYFIFAALTITSHIRPLVHFADLAAPPLINVGRVLPWCFAHLSKHHLLCAALWHILNSDIKCSANDEVVICIMFHRSVSRSHTELKVA